MAVDGEASIRPLGRPGDLGWVVMAHGEMYAAEFGWDTEFEALVARIVADYAAGRDPDREAAWIAGLVGECVGFARQAGYRRVVLWTNKPLAAARHIYLAAGFSLVSEEPHHSFGVDLTGQYYQLDLAAELSAASR